MLSILDNKTVNIEEQFQKAIQDEKFLSEILEGLLSKQETIRFNCFKISKLISEKKPELIYPNWEFLIELIRSKNNFHRVEGLEIIANLARIDTDKKFENIFDEYFDLLDIESTMTSAKLAKAAGIIAKARPELQLKITKKLLGIEKTHHKSERKDLIKASIIESFDNYFEEAENKEEILEFIKKQLKAKSPKTIKMAKSFLKKWN
ncbi:MAG: hypothetical protein EAX96_15640 [Candidatus Lokiarchaeota archaeon]|nr:hypothetical protein [Candidatus Lokiarchaeota archaeon]